MNTRQWMISFAAISAATVSFSALPPVVCETPASIACVYGLTPAVPGCSIQQTTINPSGGHGAIAVVEALDNPHAQSDLNIFIEQFSLKQVTIQTIYSPAAPSHLPLASGCSHLLPPNLAPPVDCTTAISGNNNPCDEHVADLEWSHAMAPDAAIIMVEAPSDNIWDKMYAVCYAAQAVAAAGGGVVSMSWSTSEFPQETGYDAYFKSTSNVIYVASSGDYSAPARYPSSSPYVVSAGGSTIVRNPNGNFQTETAWSTNATKASGDKNGASGGPSMYEPRPAYQNSLMKIIGMQRGTPDIAFDSNPDSGVCVYSSLHTQSPGWMHDGGTSLAAPSLSGIINAANHASNSIDELNLIYSYASKRYHQYWRDVIVGNNGFPAMVGYDFTTGLGTPLGYEGK